MSWMHCPDLKYLTGKVGRYRNYYVFDSSEISTGVFSYKHNLDIAPNIIHKLGGSRTLPTSQGVANHSVLKPFHVLICYSVCSCRP